MPKKYKVIAKVKNNPDGTAQCVKYGVSDLIKFCQSDMSRTGRFC